MSEFVRLEVDGGVGTIRLDRPPMNALNAAVQDGLLAAATEAAGRADVRAVVLYGGPKVFAAGADIKEMIDRTYADMAGRQLMLSRACDAIAAIPKPVIAAVSGYALGGGCEIALAADFRIAGDNAKLGQPEILLGIIPGAGGTQRLARLVGASRAKELVFTGRFVDAGEALGIGLVDEVVPPDDVYRVARERAEQYVSGPAAALAAAKAAIDGGLEVDLTSGIRLESQLFAGLFATEDRVIGMRSFVEHGPGKAEFVGR